MQMAAPEAVGVGLQRWLCAAQILKDAHERGYVPVTGFDVAILLFQHPLEHAQALHVLQATGWGAVHIHRWDDARSQKGMRAGPWVSGPR